MEERTDPVMDPGLCHKLGELVEVLTTSGENALDVNTMKSLKKICRQSDTYVKYCYHLALNQLEKGHSEIRLSSFQIMAELFQRSHCFRELLLNDFKLVMELTLETDADLPLPPPKSAAKLLKDETAKAIQSWHEKFGQDYKKLDLGYNYLKTCRKINLEEHRVRSAAERQREEERARRQEVQQQERLQAAVSEMNESVGEVKTCILQACNCLSLLLPDPDEFQIPGLQSPRVFRQDINPWALPKHAKGLSEITSEDKSTEKSILPDTEKQDSSFHANDASKSAASERMNCSDTDVCDLCRKQIKGKSLSDEDTSSSLCSCISKPVPSNSADVTDTSLEDAESSGTDSEDMSEEEEVEMNQGRVHGIGSHSFSLTIDMFPDIVHIQETEDNTDILLNLKDSARLIQNKFMPAVKRWLDVFTKTGADQSNVQKALDMRKILQDMLDKINKIRIKKAKVIQGNTTSREEKQGEEHEEEEEEEDEFEEVPGKEGFEPRIPEHMREEYGLVEAPPKPGTSKDWKLTGMMAQEEDDPTTWVSAVKRLQAEMGSGEGKPPVPLTKKATKDKVSDEQSKKDEAPGTSSGGSTVRSPHKTSSATCAKEKEASEKDGKDRKRAPVVPYSMDLYHWGEDEQEVPLLVRYDSEHRFWTPNENEDVVDKNALESMKSRVINFAGSFEPVKWMCRAPLPNGKLCPRMDRVKCPFHGRIVGRDNMGRPTDPKDAEMLEKEHERIQQEGVPEWEDPELQAEIQAATGVDVSRKGGKGKGKGRKAKKEKYPDLTNINTVKDSRSRLQRKILSKRAVSRVADAMNAIDAKRFKDKFGNSFNYTFSHR